MAARTFLNEEELEEASHRLEPLIGNLKWKPGQKDYLKPNYDFSQWLSEKLLKRLSQFDGWEEVLPVALGSWSRNELTPKSDVDLILAGPHDIVKKFVDQIQEEGLKIRYRVPEDPKDWTKGVEPFDVLALYFGKHLSPKVQIQLAEQQEQIFQNISIWRPAILKAMIQERKIRSQRYDSVSNFLEPNIKYGPGGLRDLQQALYVYEIFKDKQVGYEKAIEALKFYKAFFLTLRQKLHLLGANDILASNFQKELTEWFGKSHISQFMKDLQIGLSEVSFYADAVVERAKLSKPKFKKIEKQPLKKLSDCFKALEISPTPVMQFRVREYLREHAKEYSKASEYVGQQLYKNFNVSKDEKFLKALFRSQLLESFLPDLQRVKGLVLHDQYHRYTVDAHLLQAVKQLKRLVKHPKQLGKLAFLVKELNEQDFRILIWTCLYHDLGKGKGGGHSEKGAEIVKRNFTKMGISLRHTVEVTWMVRNHLTLSNAAFRLNPLSPSTWNELHKQGVAKKRLVRLALFTIVDIIATNPEAWNTWKERLLFDLLVTLRSPRASKFMKLLADAEVAKVALSPEFIRHLDPAIVESVPTKYLLQDYKKLKKSKKQLDPLVVRGIKGDLWVRFHTPKDRSGLFLSYVNQLHSAACNIKESYINTYKRYGVYDWFKVKSTKSPKQLQKMITLLGESEYKVPKIFFDSLHLMSEEEDEAIISFRGKNQKGALMAAAHALFANKMPIKWARVHTWGRQIDDTFCVEKKGNLKETLETLRSNLIKENGSL